MQIFKLHIGKYIGLILCFFSFLSANAQTSSEEAPTISLPGLLQAKDHNGTGAATVEDNQAHVTNNKKSSYNVNVQGGVYRVTTKAKTYDNSGDIWYNPTRALSIEIRSFDKSVGIIQLPHTHGEWDQSAYTEITLPAGQYTLSLSTGNSTRRITFEWVNFHLIKSIPKAPPIPLPGLLQAEYHDDTKDVSTYDNDITLYRYGNKNEASYDVDVQEGWYGVTIKADAYYYPGANEQPTLDIMVEDQVVATIDIIGNSKHEWTRTYAELALPAGKYSLSLRVGEETMHIDWVSFQRISLQKPVASTKRHTLPGLLQAKDHDRTTYVSIQDDRAVLTEDGEYTVDYQVYAQRGVYKVAIQLETQTQNSKFITPAGRVIEIMAQGKVIKTVELENVFQGSKQTIYTEVELLEGPYTLTLKADGKMTLDSFEFDRIKEIVPVTPLPGFLKARDHDGTTKVYVEDKQVFLTREGDYTANYQVSVQRSAYNVSIQLETYTKNSKFIIPAGRVIEIIAKGEVVKTIELEDVYQGSKQTIHAEVELPEGEYTLALKADGKMTFYGCYFDLIKPKTPVKQHALPGLLQAKDHDRTTDVYTEDDRAVLGSAGNYTANYQVNVQRGSYKVTIQLETHLQNPKFKNSVGRVLEIIVKGQVVKTIQLEDVFHGSKQTIQTEVELPEGEYILALKSDGKMTLDSLDFELIKSDNQKAAKVTSLPGLLQAENHNGTNDVYVSNGQVELGAFSEKKVSYNVNVKGGFYGVNIKLETQIQNSRFAFPAGRMIEVIAKGKLVKTIKLKDVFHGSKQTIHTEVELPEGRYTLTLRTDGTMTFDWLKFNLIRPDNKSSEKQGVEKALVYPNPFTTAFKVELKEEYQAESLEIINRNGHVVYTQKVDAANTQTEVKPQSLAEGDYVLRIYGKDGKVYTKRLLKVQ